MSTEEKILAILEKHSQMFEQVFSRMDQMQEDQAQMRKDQRQMREEQQQMREEQRQMRDDLTSVKLRLELDVEKRFDGVNEGIDAILEKLTPKNRVDELEADIVVLKAAIKVLTQEVAELKKAQ